MAQFSTGYSAVAPDIEICWCAGAMTATYPGPAETLTGLMYNEYSDDHNAMITCGYLCIIGLV